MNSTFPLATVKEKFRNNTSINTLNVIDFHYAPNHCDPISMLLGGQIDLLFLCNRPCVWYYFN